MNKYISIIFEAAKAIIVLFILSWLMGEVFKWFIKQPHWLKLALISFFFCFVFWFPFVDHFFTTSTHELVWYKSLLYALIPATLWYFMNLGLMYYAVYLAKEDIKTVHKENFFWIAFIGDMLGYFILLACIMVVATSNWIVFVAILFGYKLLGFLVIPRYIKSLDK